MSTAGPSGDSAATVAVLHTPGGAGGIAVIGLAGPEAESILAEVFTPRSPARGASSPGEVIRLGDLYDGDQRLDEAIVTATGASAEINIHGGPRVAQRTLEVLRRAGATIVPDRPAAWDALATWPLAFEGLGNPAIGRELLESLPHVHTQTQLAALTEQWRAGVSELARGALSGSGPLDVDLAGRLLDAADRLTAMRRLLSPWELALAGPPNAGKSTLTNALAGREVGIVTDTPGTTRDWVRESADIGGAAVWLTDTAGLFSPDDTLDAEAVRRSWRRIERADCVLAVWDASDPPADDDAHWRRLMAEPNVLPVANKCDLTAGPAGVVAVSAATGEGLEALRRAIVERMSLADFDPAVPAAFTPRQVDCLRRAGEAIGGGDSDGARRALVRLLEDR